MDLGEKSEKGSTAAATRRVHLCAVLGLALLALVGFAPGARAATRAHPRHHRHAVVNHAAYRAASTRGAQTSFPFAPRSAPPHAHRRAVLLPGPSASSQRTAARPLPRVGAAFCEDSAGALAIRSMNLDDPAVDRVTGITLGDKMGRGPPRALPYAQPTPQRSLPSILLELATTPGHHCVSERPFGRSRAASLKGTAARLCAPFAGDEA